MLSEKQRIGALSIRMDLLARLLEKSKCNTCVLKRLKSYLVDALDECECNHYERYVTVNTDVRPVIITVPKTVYNLMSKRIDTEFFRIVPWTAEKPNDHVA